MRGRWAGRIACVQLGQAWRCSKADGSHSGSVRRRSSAAPMIRRRRSAGRAPGPGGRAEAGRHRYFGGRAARDGRSASARRSGRAGRGAGSRAPTGNRAARWSARAPKNTSSIGSPAAWARTRYGARPPGDDARGSRSRPAASPSLRHRRGERRPGRRVDGAAGQMAQQLEAAGLRAARADGLRPPPRPGLRRSSEVRDANSGLSRWAGRIGRPARALAGRALCGRSRVLASRHGHGSLKERVP